jgi:hypothetical protein
MSNIKRAIFKNKTGAIAIVALLIFSMSASMMLLPTTSAQSTPGKFVTYAYVQANPNPCGVNSYARVYMWLEQVLPDAYLGNDIRFHDYELTITSPNDSVTTQTFPVISDPTSSQGYSFYVTQVGTYTLNFTFPGQTYNFNEIVPGEFGAPPSSSAIYIGNVYEPSHASATLIVQQTAPPVAPNVPLPSAYWTYPIYGENYLWYSISSNWLGVSAPGFGTGYPGDAVGPQTAHIMWTRPDESGGVVGGDEFVTKGDTYFEGSAYAQRFENPIILDGMLFYTEPLSFSGVGGSLTPNPTGPTVAVNLQTGQTIWSSTKVPWLTFGYIYDVQEPNQHGVYQPILFAQTGGATIFGPVPESWMAFDAYTGTPLFNVTNVPIGATARGPNGEYLIYVLANDGTPTNPQYYLAQWNSSNLWYGQYNGLSTTPTVIPPITDGSNPLMFDWNISIPSLHAMTLPSSIVDVISGNMVLGMSGSYPTPLGAVLEIPSSTPSTYFAINLNATNSAIGTVLWTNTLQPPAGNITVSFAGADPTADAGHGVFVEKYKETMQLVGYSMATGKYLWTTPNDEVAFQYYSTLGYYSGGLGGVVLAYGNAYAAGFGGIVYCYSLATGNLLWTYGNGGAGNSTNSGEPYPGNYPTTIYAIGNGIVYLITTEHTVTTPIYKGALTSAINATNGAQIYTLSDYCSAFNTATAAIADGYATIYNGYDNQIYCLGRGPSDTTVQAPQMAITAGTRVVIQGTVMDISAGTKQLEQAADFPNGVPCASDACMTAWMGYVYQQQPHPTNFTGVTVTLSVLDPNNNTYTVGTATTDINGIFHYTWTPKDVPGTYTVYATFSGTNGYWPSESETNMVVQSASATTAPTSTPVSGLASNTTVEYGIVAIIIIIIIIGAILALLVTRKRP